MQKHLANIIIIMLFAAATAHARQGSLQTIELQYTQAETMIEKLKPLNIGSVKLTGNQNILILQGHPNHIQQVRALISQLDKPLEMLLISVKQGTNESHQQYSRGISGQSSHSNIQFKHHSTLDREGTGHQVKVLDGHVAYIETGEEFPYVAEYHEDFNSSSAGIRYKKAASGFYVLPTVQGNDAVLLQISPFKNLLSRHGGSKVDTQSMESTIRIKFGEWINIGGAFQGQTTNQNGYTYSTKRRDISSSTIEIKVEKLSHD